MADDPKLQRAAEIDKAIKDADAKRRADEEKTGQTLDKLLTKLDEMVDHVGGLSKRMDDFEKRYDDDAKRKKARKDDDDANDDHHEDDHEPVAEQPTQTPNMAKEVVADSLRADDDARRYETDLADAQARADSIAIEFGEHAPRPLSGERLFDYKRRLLRRYQRYSPDFKDVDLGKITDAATWSGIENKIYNDAREAAGRPQAGPGQLRERIRTIRGVEYHDSSVRQRRGSIRPQATALVVTSPGST